VRARWRARDASWSAKALSRWYYAGETSAVNGRTTVEERQCARRGLLPLAVRQVGRRFFLRREARALSSLFSFRKAGGLVGTRSERLPRLKAVSSSRLTRGRRRWDSRVRSWGGQSHEDPARGPHRRASSIGAQRRRRRRPPQVLQDHGPAGEGDLHGGPRRARGGARLRDKNSSEAPLHRDDQDERESSDHHVSAREPAGWFLVLQGEMPEGWAVHGPVHGPVRCADSEVGTSATALCTADRRIPNDHRDDEYHLDDEHDTAHDHGVHGPVQRTLRLCAVHNGGRRGDADWPLHQPVRRDGLPHLDTGAVEVCVRSSGRPGAPRLRAGWRTMLPVSERHRLRWR